MSHPTNDAENRLLERVFELDTLALDTHDIDVPNNLADKLYAIADADRSENMAPQKQRWRLSLASVASIALATAVFLFVQPNQAEREAEAARQELAVAFEYLELTHRKAHPHITNNLREGMQRSTLHPIFNSARAVHL